MSTPSTANTPSPFTRKHDGALASAAHLAATSTGSAVGLVSLEAGDIAVWAGAGGVAASAVTSPDGSATRRLLAALAAAPHTSRKVRAFSEHSELKAVVGASVEGLVSVATSPIRDTAGATIGLVGAFDRVPRDWDDELEQLDAIAELLSRSAPALWQAEMTHVVAGTIQSLEHSLGDGRIQAVLDIAARSEDPALRRQVSEAQASLDHVSLLRGRLRAALRATPFARPRTAIFDLVSTTEQAVGDACARHRIENVPVSCSEREIPVAGDADRAHLAIFRCVTAALHAGHPSDLSIHVGSRDLQSHRLDGSVVGELTISVKGRVARREGAVRGGGTHSSERRPERPRPPR